MKKVIALVMLSMFVCSVAFAWTTSSDCYPGCGKASEGMGKTKLGE
jgi:hypothetical protein